MHIVVISHDQNTSNRRTTALSKIVYIENQIACGIEAYIKSIYNIRRTVNADLNRDVEEFLL